MIDCSVGLLQRNKSKISSENSTGLLVIKGNSMSVSKSHITIFIYITTCRINTSIQDKVETLFPVAYTYMCNSYIHFISLWIHMISVSIETVGKYICMELTCIENKRGWAKGNLAIHSFGASLTYTQSSSKNYWCLWSVHMIYLYVYMYMY